MNFYIKLIFSLIFLLSTLFSQTQRGSNIPSGEDIPPSISGNGQVIVVKHETNAFTVYAWNGSAWAQRLNANINAFSVDIDYDGSTIAVGSPSTNSAFVYQWNGSTYTQQASLSPPTGAVNFGTSVAISNDGDVIVVGSPDTDTNSMVNNGIVNVYNFNS